MWIGRRGERVVEVVGETGSGRVLKIVIIFIEGECRRVN
jgi:hypothetical protein